MIEIPPEKFHHAATLFSDCVADRAWLFPNLDRRVGRLFGNDPEAPTSVLYVVPGSVSFLGGDPRGFNAGELVAQYDGLKAGLKLNSKLIPIRQDWVNSYITDSDFRFCEFQRLSFLSGPEPDAVCRYENAVPAGYAVRKMDEVLAAEVASGFDPDFSQRWPDPAEFAVRGIGFCVLHGRTVASCAWSSWEPAKYILITVRTAPEHRGHSLACVATAALIRWATDRGLQADWNTGAANFPSQKSARKLGYGGELRHNWIQYTPFHANKRAVHVPTVRFDELAGEYVHQGSGTRFGFSRVGDRFLFHEHGVPLHQMVPLSGERFFLRNENVEMTFHPDATPPHLVMQKDKRNYTFDKVSRP